jgi:hypothetical protein
VSVQSRPKSSRLTRASLVALLVCLLLLPALGGCDWEDWVPESEQEQAKDTAMEWAEAKGLDPVNDDGSVNTDGVVEVAKRLVTGSTGDPEIDAALNSDNALTKIEEADKLDERGWKENEGRDFDYAVKLRPEDWKYRVSRAAWNMNNYARPDMDKVDADLRAAENLLGPGKEERIQYAQQGIRQFEGVKVTMSKPYVKGEPADLFARPRDCRTVFTQLSHFYNILADQTGDGGARDMAAQYTRDLGMCAPLR